MAFISCPYAVERVISSEGQVTFYVTGLGQYVGPFLDESLAEQVATALESAYCQGESASEREMRIEALSTLRNRKTVSQSLNQQQEAEFQRLATTGETETIGNAESRQVD